VSRIACGSLGILLSLGLVLYVAGCSSETAVEIPSSTPAQETHDDHAAGAGHGESAGHGDAHGHAEPENLAAGVAMVKEHYEKIKEAFEAGKADDAHGPLHNVGALLESIPELAKAAGLADQKNAELQKAVDAMIEAYTKIDSAMHKGEQPDYAAVSGVLDENMAAIEKAASGQ